MAGIKISELNKWSIEEIKHIDPSDIVIPVSINTVTGALRSKTLIDMLTYSDVFVNTTSELSEQLGYALTYMNERIDSLSYYIDVLKENQSYLDASQSYMINVHEQTLSYIGDINDEQTSQIDTLYNWEEYKENLDE